MEDGIEQFSGGGDDRLAGSPSVFDVRVEPAQVRAVPNRDQGALHERGAGQFVASLGDVPTVACFV